MRRSSSQQQRYEMEIEVKGMPDRFAQLIYHSARIFRFTVTHELFNQSQISLAK
jgi:hypothetical protein